MSRRTVLAVVSSLLLAATAMAEEVAPASPALGFEEQVARFFADLGEGEYARAIETLYAGNPWMKSEDLGQVKAQFEALPTILGELRGTELLSQQRITDRYVFLWYVAAFDRSPVSFYLKFYKPTDTWRFYSFEYKEDLGQVARDLALRQIEAGSGSADPAGGG